MKKIDETEQVELKQEKQQLDIASLSFEQALTHLEEIVSKLEHGDVALEQSICIYEQGEALKKHCETLLQSAENKIEKIRLDREGVPKASEPLDA